MITKTLDYNDGDTVLEGYLAYEESDTQKPLVLVAHDWTGRREFACKAAERVAGLGYVGFALDMYGKGIFGTDGDTAGNSALMGPYAADRALLRRRIRAALVAGRNIPQVKADSGRGHGLLFRRHVRARTGAFRRRRARRGQYPRHFRARRHAQRGDSRQRCFVCTGTTTPWRRPNRCWRSSRK